LSAGHFVLPITVAPPGARGLKTIRVVILLVGFDFEGSWTQVTSTPILPLKREHVLQATPGGIRFLPLYSVILEPILL